MGESLRLQLLRFANRRRLCAFRTQLRLQIPGVQPTTTPDDCLLAEAIIMADPRIKQVGTARHSMAQHKTAMAWHSIERHSTLEHWFDIFSVDCPRHWAPLCP